jgi:hypothetical protein
MKRTKHVGHQNACQICNKKGLETILSYGHQPVVQEYLTEKELNEPEVTYPINLSTGLYC